MAITARPSLLNLPTLCVDADIAASMARIVEASGLSREQVVDRLNEAAIRYGVRICSGSAQALSLPTFEKWLNPNEPGNVPSTRALNLFCHVLGTIDPLAILAQSHGWGCRVIDAEGARVLDIALIDEEIKRLRSRKRKKEEELCSGI